MNRRACIISTAVALMTCAAGPVLADQADCEDTVRALMAPYGDNAPDHTLNRFGTSVTKIGELEVKGYSLQTAEGSLYFDADKSPVSLSFVNGDVYTSTDKGKTWTKANSTPKEVMDQAIAGIVSQAEKARNIACEYGVDLNGRLVNHYVADFEIYNTGTPTHTEYWVDPENGFVWRDTMHSMSTPEVFSIVDAEPAPDMVLPDPNS